MRQRLFLISGMICAIMAGQLPALELASEGRAKAAIVLADRPTRSAQLAAAELQEHLRLMTGATFPLASESQPPAKGLTPIYVGESCYTRRLGLTSNRFPPQEWLVRVTDEAIFLIGRDDPDFGEITYEENGAWPGFDGNLPYHRLGSLHATYDFLERWCGVRWYMITDLGRVLPSRATLNVKTGEYYGKPWTSYRRIGAQMNWGVPGQPGRFDGIVYRYDTLPSLRDRNLYQLRTRMGGEPFSANHTFYDYYARFGKTHPDWFVDGVPGPTTQLRYDHPEVIAQIAKDAAAFLSLPSPERWKGKGEGHPIASGDFFSVVPHDNRAYGSDTTPPLQPDRHGPRGTSGSGIASNYIFTCVNKVAAQIAQTHPDGWISALAYADNFQPPEFKLEDNVAVAVCMADGWSGYGMDVLRQWRDQASRLYTWEYTFTQGRFPLLRAHQTSAYIEELRTMGLDGMFMELGDRNSALYHLDYYVTTRMLFDPEAHADDILNEYYALFYGPAEKPMAAFWQRMEAISERVFAKKGVSPAQTWTTTVTDDDITFLGEALKEAGELASMEPYHSRLGVVRTGVLDMIVKDRQFYRKVAATPPPSLPVWKTATPLKIDGKLDDAGWTNAAETSAFVTGMNNPQIVRTVARVMRDDRFLYIGFRCSEPKMGSLRTFQAASSPNICTDDSVEVLLDIDRSNKDYLHIMINADGISWYQWKGRYTMNELPDLGILGAASKGDGEWTAELAIPFERILQPGERPKGEWGIQLARNRYTDRFKEEGWIDEAFFHLWSPTFALSYHIPDRFGILRFDKEP